MTHQQALRDTSAIQPLSSSSPSNFPYDDNAYDSIPMDIGDDGDMAVDDGGYDPIDNYLPMNPPQPVTMAMAQQPKPIVSKPSARPQKVYVLLDPHAVVGGSRPAKKGRVYRLPATLAKKNRDAAFDPVQELYNDYWKQENWKNYQLDKPTRGALFEPCLLPLLKARKTIERRVTAQQRFKQHAKPDYNIQQEWIDDDGPEADYFEEGQADPMMDMIYGRHDQIDSAPLAPMPAMEQQMMDNYEYDGMDMDHGPIDSDGNNGGQPIDEEEDLARRVEAALQNENNYQYNYEMICKQFIDEFHRGAEAFARETQLSKRVNEWTYKLEPILQAQEEAKPFDIHECSDEVLNVLSKETKSRLKASKSMEKKQQVNVPFHVLADGESNAEVCRKFLACLQLANLGNVEIVGKPNGRQVEISNDFQLKLLSEKRTNELENFLAPSLLTK